MALLWLAFGLHRRLSLFCGDQKKHVEFAQHYYNNTICLNNV